MARTPKKQQKRNRVTVSVSRETYQALVDFAAKLQYPTPVSKIAEHAIHAHIEKEAR